MAQQAATPPNSRAMRLIHMALVLGTTLCGVVFVVVRRVTPLPVLAEAPVIGIVLAVSAIALLGVALTVLRSRVPQQAPEQSIDGYWGEATVRTTVITLWAVVEGASLLGAVGYLLTGATPPGLAFGLGVVTLLSLRPSRFELGEG